MVQLGCRMTDLVSNNLWWHGPHRLTKYEDAPYGPNHHGQATDTVGRLTKRWRYKKKLIAYFWNRWRSEYIISFCTRSKW
ncbi:conserved hypothetical protein [Trichinella spiralis]|uniref:hypothetical protein n=1 Tax=Trichinella spiralis TaxID=6334 RepID=UPI0001EFE57A|nr:conserved hypothetical protein [Trichinella spiralis]